jgi:2-polyprenyl-3-methyl-5-hydroxy-6-metoxy-1,4-benzoquinol methylase
MIHLQRAGGQPERLDSPEQHPRWQLESSLEHVAAVNRWLGGRRALLHHVARLWPTDRPARILDVGTGSADLPRAVVDWARRRKLRTDIVAVDLQPEMLSLARERCAAYPEIVLEQADALALPFASSSFDLALLSLTLHHFEDEQQLRALRELGRVAGMAVIVSELERCWPNYLGARLLAATVWRRNPITRHDGPLSVLRAFTTDELLGLAATAELPAPRVHRHFFHRLVLVAVRDSKRT